MTTGEQVRHHRDRLGMTQAQLAARLGVHPKTVLHWEGDRHAPPAATLRTLRNLRRRTPKEPTT